MTDLTEEERAQLWRDQRERRAKFQSDLWDSLAGSPEAYAEFYARWEPLIEWLAERELPEVDPQDELDPLGISDQVNVGR